MEFDNAFEVPLPADDAWKVLMDVRRMATCMPGAELTDVIDERTYKGKIGVRLGPVALTFAGTVKFEDIDDAGHTARVVAQGTDAKGRGAANAVATFRLESAGGTAETGTKVLVHTNLTLSGAVAQYGRGVGIIQMTAAQIITQFANNLKAQLDRDGAAAMATAAETTAAGALSPGVPTANTVLQTATLEGVPPSGEAVRTLPVSATPAAARPAVGEGNAPQPAGIAAKPISGFSLIASVLWAVLKRLFGRA